MTAEAPRLRSSLLARMLRGVVALILLGGVLVALTAWRNGAEAARQAYDRILLGAANDIAESIRIDRGAPVPVLPVSAFDLLAQAPDDRVAYAVRGPDGAVLAGMADTPQAPAPRGSAPRFFAATMQDEEARFVTVTRLFAERDFSGAVTVTVGQTLRARQQMALDLMADALVPLAVAGLAFLLLALAVVRTALRPLDRIAADLSARDPQDLTPMDETSVPAEVGVILRAMNRFMGRLDRQVGAMQVLISDTAHQLRTPVAAIRAQAEQATDDPDPARQRAALERLLKRTRSLGTLLDQLLSRALVVHRTDSAQRVALDLRDVALEVVESRDHEVLSPGAEVSLILPEAAVMVLADDFSLQQAVRNLMSNALTHGRAPVRIGVEGAGAEARIWVGDGGPGPGADVLRALGTRFARSASSAEDGAGIGLSIVAAVAQAFDGRIETGAGRDGWRITLVLPRIGGDA